jgi:hypothetical protein
MNDPDRTIPRAVRPTVNRLPEIGCPVVRHNIAEPFATVPSG